MRPAAVEIFIRDVNSALTAMDPDNPISDLNCGEVAEWLKAAVC
jgi:hypothetical protein